jgi:hypothetical protein
MSDLEARVRTVLLEDASHVPLVGRMPEHVRSRVRRQRAVTVVTASLAASLLIAGSVFAVRSLDRSGVMPAPPAPASPISEDWMLEDRLRPSHIVATGAWEDPRDASVAGVDMTRLKYAGGSQPHWYLELAGNPPKDRTTAEVVSYGLVLDTTEDGVPDYLVGIEDDPTWPGDVLTGDQHSPRHIYRVWVTDLATGVTDERGPPYGFPIEFHHPDERGADIQMLFTFLGSSAPDDMEAGSVRFYAWASLTRDGAVVARDVAPDEGWMTRHDA